MKDNKVSLIKNRDFIIFGEDFSRHPHALEHLLRPLFNTNRFLWVETIGLRSPKIGLYDCKRVLEKVKKWCRFSNTKQAKVKDLTHPNSVIIVVPFIIPFNQFTLIRYFNQWNVTRVVKKNLRIHKFSNTITIASVPNACDFVGSFSEKLKIYFCVDEFSLWPGLDSKLVTSFEKKLIEKSDLIIATSESLAQAKAYYKNKDVPIISHGVEFNHFNIGIKKGIHNRPFQICYFGLFDERTDQSIIASILQDVPDVEIHIIGNVVCETKNLKNLKNLFFHGPILYRDLPNAITEMDLFILPYKKNDLTHYINPLKLKEYLATGRPVIATDLPEVVKLKKYLMIGQTPQDFVNHITQLKSNSTLFNSEDTVNYIRENETWDAKALLLSQIIGNC